MTHDDSGVAGNLHTRNPPQSQVIILPNPVHMRFLGSGFSYKRAISASPRRATYRWGKMDVELHFILGCVAGVYANK